ncbi:Tfp pilus assembly protein PilF [Dyadobacter jejuensis]|uniref:Tfp pilus assembly protein PilF n=1 Tax=Dyadobacter jejuensis TaxID=1082580 RepID=A0A316ANR6_9BACT|nr:tetratricopeptide repeat protein [Dyadobacter jejuensis]PWJ58959.1 Tfp pilus assembly protein PilF [Dyadobacter jejuensis]
MFKFNGSVYFTLLIILINLQLTGCSSQSKKDASDFFLKANAALAKNNYEEALKWYDEAIAKNEDFSDAYLNKGIVLTKLHRTELAYECLTTALAKDPTLLQAHMARAEVALLLGKIQIAQEDLSSIKTAYQDSSHYYLVSGNLLTQQGQPGQALTAYDRAIQLASDHVEAYVNRGYLYYHENNLKLAEQDFLQALKINPTQTEALNNLGLIATQNQQYPLAQGYFDRALQLKPNDAYSLNNLGYVLLQLNENEQALKNIQKSITILPTNGYAHRNLGLYYAQQSDWAKAITAFQKAIEIADPVDGLYAAAGMAYFKSGQAATACKLWTQGQLLKDSTAIQYLQAHCK